MTPHELMIKTNYHLINGGTLTEAQKANIVRQLLASRTDEVTKRSFYRGVRTPEYPAAQGKSDDGRVMYPLYYIPPYNGGKKLQTLLPMYPKTHILAANSYELEIIRLLHLFAPDNPAVKEMTKKTLKRLKTTCFGYNDCHHGECFHSALITLRFVAAVSEDTQWIEKLIRFFGRHKGGKYHHANTFNYFYLCLTELPPEIAKPELEHYREDVTARLEKLKKQKTAPEREVLIAILEKASSYSKKIYI